MSVRYAYSCLLELACDYTPRMIRLLKDRVENAATRRVSEFICIFTLTASFSWFDCPYSQSQHFPIGIDIMTSL